MALRLAGEEYCVVQGLDSDGWPRQVAVADALPGFKVNQQGTGRTFDFQDGGTSILYADDGADIVAIRAVDARSAIKNAGAANSGHVYVDDGLWVTGRVGVGIAPDATYHLFVNETASNGKMAKFRSGLGGGSNFFVEYNNSLSRLELYGDKSLAIPQAVSTRSINAQDSSNNDRVVIDTTLYALKLFERATHVADGDVPEDWGVAYVYNSAGTRQLVVKLKDGGTVYTGTLSLT